MWLADASPPSSAITRSSNLTVRANSLSTIICCCWITTFEAGVSATSPANLVVAEALESVLCCKVAV